MFQINQEFIPFQDKLYLLKRTLKEADRPIVDTWKEHLRADIVLRKDGLLYFLQEVVDLEIIP